VNLLRAAPLPRPLQRSRTWRLVRLVVTQNGEDQRLAVHSHGRGHNFGQHLPAQLPIHYTAASGKLAQRLLVQVEARGGKAGSAAVSRRLGRPAPGSTQHHHRRARAPDAFCLPAQPRRSADRRHGDRRREAWTAGPRTASASGCRAFLRRWRQPQPFSASSYLTLVDRLRRTQPGCSSFTGKRACEPIAVVPQTLSEIPEAGPSGWPAPRPLPPPYLLHLLMSRAGHFINTQSGAPPSRRRRSMLHPPGAVQASREHARRLSAAQSAAQRRPSSSRCARPLAGLGVVKTQGVGLAVDRPSATLSQGGLDRPRFAVSTSDTVAIHPLPFPLNAAPPALDAPPPELQAAPSCRVSAHGAVLLSGHRRHPSKTPPRGYAISLQCRDRTLY